MSSPLPWLFPEVSLALAQTRSSLSNGRVQAWNLLRSQKWAMCDSFLTWKILKVRVIHGDFLVLSPSRIWEAPLLARSGSPWIRCRWSGAGCLEIHRLDDCWWMLMMLVDVDPQGRLRIFEKGGWNGWSMLKPPIDYTCHILSPRVRRWELRLRIVHRFWRLTSILWQEPRTSIPSWSVGANLKWVLMVLQILRCLKDGRDEANPLHSHATSDTFLNKIYMVLLPLSLSLSLSTGKNQYRSSDWSDHKDLVLNKDYIVFSPFLIFPPTLELTDSRLQLASGKRTSERTGRLYWAAPCHWRVEAEGGSPVAPLLAIFARKTPHETPRKGKNMPVKCRCYPSFLL